MDFARQQRDPTRHLIGITVVIVLHVIVIYALVTGLASKAIQVIKKPLNATIVEEIKVPPPPPPPPPKKVEIPKVPPPPEQPYIPPPDIPPPVVQSEPVIAAVTPTPPATPPVIAPPPPPAPPAKPAIRKGITAISKVDPVYPKQAIMKGIDSGTVVAHVYIDEKGNVTEVKIIQADPPKYFDRSVIDALMQWKFAAEGEKFIGEIEVNFHLQ